MVGAHSTSAGCHDGLEFRRDRQSAELVRPALADVGQTAGLFYDRLFEIAPEVRPLFRHDIDEQKRKFIATLAVIVGSLDDSSKLDRAAPTALARQHVSFGVQPAHYSLVGEACCGGSNAGSATRGRRGVAASWTQRLRHHLRPS